MENKTSQLLEVLKTFSLSDALKVELRDPQYRALEKLYTSIRDKELFLKLVLVNALLSYQLPTKGEIYWQRFGDFFSKNPSMERFEEFLTLYNNRFLKAKLKRLQKVLKVIEPLRKEDLEKLCQNPTVLLDYLSEKLSQDRESKTLVFAVKMFIYGCRIITKKPLFASNEIFIPLDVRLKKISPDKEFWKNLSREIEIPLLHLDAILWLTLGGGKKFINQIGDEQLKKKLQRLLEVLKTL